MSRKDLLNSDASSRATSELEYVIRSKKAFNEPKVRKVTAEQAMSDKRQFEITSNRNVTRVLFVSQDTELLNPTTQSLDGYIDIKDLFDEVHILILREGIVPKNPVIRVAKNVWVYTAAANYWWLTPAKGIDLVINQLEFASGFRPDLIVARDPFESAIVAYMLGKKYNRPTQLHVLDDYSDKDFVKKNCCNLWRRFLPRFTIPKFSSVRTQTKTIKNILQKNFSIRNLDILPRYQDYESLINKKLYVDLKSTYKPIIFFLLYIGSLDHNSTFHRAIDSARFVLKNRRVGMIVIGDGSARGEFVKRTKVLGIEKQVIFLPKVSSEVSFLKSANMLIVTDTDLESEELVLKGAASGIPIVMAKTERRSDIFVNGESAFLCEPTDIQAFADSINIFLNDLNVRKLFSENGQHIIKKKFHSDPNVYRKAYRTSIEQAIFIDNHASNKP